MFYKWIPFIVIAIFDVLVFLVLWKISKYYGGPIVLTPGDHKLDPPEEDFLKSAFITYPISAAIQQLVILILFHILRNFMPLQYAIIVTSFIFMSAHFPNVVLMFAVLGMEMILLTLFSMSNIFFFFMMILTHALLASCLLKFFGEDLHHGFRVLWDWWKKGE